jgi:glucosamine-6-phosphate deaminase
MKKLYFEVGKLHVEVHPDAQAIGHAAAQATAEAMRGMAAQQEAFGVIFATGASQLDTLRAVVSERNLPWNKIQGFHLDEYIGLDVNHPASFRRYLRDNLVAYTHMRNFLEIDGESDDPKAVCREYAQALREANPQLCLLGIGENGHLAFNDPGEADFQDPQEVKVVSLDEACRRQQAAEGWFKTLEDVPKHAITLTIPAILRVPRLIVSVPGIRKAKIVRRTLYGPVSSECPATILRAHPHATLYLDLESASELNLPEEVRARA